PISPKPRIPDKEVSRNSLQHQDRWSTGLGEVGDDAYGGRDPRQAVILAALGGHGSDGGGDGKEEAAAEAGEAETGEVGGGEGSRKKRRRRRKPKGANKGGRSRGRVRRHLR
ncbi:hypothetical protein GW17_00050493, partial [Ensete ventricosum]